MISPKKDGAAFFVHKMGKVVKLTLIDFVLCDALVLKYIIGI